MKLYKFFYIMDDAEYEKNRNRVDISGMNHYDYRTKTWTILYGFTNNKDLFESFLITHANPSMVVKTHKESITKEEYEKFRKEWFMQEILYKGIVCNTDEDQIMLPVVKSEYVYSISDMEENCIFFMSEYATIPFWIFNEKFQWYLSQIYYTNDFISANDFSYVTGYDVEEELRDIINYNMGFISPRKCVEISFYLLLYSDFLDLDAIRLLMTFSDRKEG